MQDSRAGEGLERVAVSPGLEAAEPAREAVSPEREAVKPGRDPVLRRKNRRLGLLLVGICLVMAACGFAYVRWLMMRPAGAP